MALTYAQKDALTTTAAFLSRVNQAVAYHAKYVEGLASPTAAQLSWVHDVFIGCKCTQKSANLARELVQDPAFATTSLADASDVTDTALQGAVDAICEKY